MIVLDASAAVDALIRPADAVDLRALLGASDLQAPTLLDYEVVDALRGLSRGGVITATRAADALTDFDDLAVRRWSMGDGLRRRAFGLRHSLTAYDAAYVALAEALDCPLITRDQRLARAARDLVRIEVR
jgi:predicted nucleic acid-binding protein